ncbi:MAG: MBL fold metallo-hydrolase [Gammaproteobacteria bacterium]|nr:MBL fold metallo-hydrolase [Gammaproteobacteria bacterium]
MKIQLLFDARALNDQFKTGWGLSFSIGDHILFDTGEDGNDLLHNLKEAHIDITKINKIVISHDHYDHTGGLRAILKSNSGVLVYVPLHSRHTLKSEIEHLGGKVIELEQCTAIDQNIFVASPIPFSYKDEGLFEQVLVIKTGNKGNKTESGLIVITGCAHPGIITILNHIKKQFPNEPINTVIGGFHLHRITQPEREKIVQQFKALNIKKVAPIHCSGEETQKIFKQHYGSDYMDLRVGSISQIN